MVSMPSSSSGYRPSSSAAKRQCIRLHHDNWTTWHLHPESKCHSQ
jgi:hypothetical protein